MVLELKEFFKPFRVVNQIVQLVMSIVATFSEENNKKLIDELAERLEGKNANLLAAWVRELPKLGEVAKDLLAESQRQEG